MKAVAIVSGGIDSSTLLYYLKKQGFEIHPLTFIYGQKHSKEIRSAKAIIKRLNAEEKGYQKIKHKIINLSEIKELFGTSALTNPETPIPTPISSANGRQTDVLPYETLKITFVPNRNAILLSIAVAYAVSINAETVFYGAHFSDRGVYPDCRKEFVDAFEKASRLAIDNPKLKVIAPFIEMKKSEIVKLGSSLGVPYKLTWSCYQGGQKHCGVCSSCQERKRAFQESGIPDPTEYDA